MAASKHTLINYTPRADEVFSPVVGFPDYEISNYGTLRRLPVGVRGKGLRKKATYAKGSLNVRGYHVYKLYTLIDKRSMVAHRLVAKAFIPNPYSHPQINHKDGNKLNNHISNLEWCDNRYNAIHAMLTGLNDNRGEKSARNKYSEKLIRLALETKGKLTSKQFQAIHGIHYSYVKAIRSGHRWKHLWSEYNPRKEFDHHGSR